jgi:nitrite reductase/ring-hydroxylating ferredoxin subunit
MKHIEIDGKEITVANINGKYYALDDIDVVTHSSARLSMWIINGNIVICPFHGAEFDCTTGRKTKEPNVVAVLSTEGLPDVCKKNVEYAFNIFVLHQKTHDQKTYDIIISMRIG